MYILHIFIVKDTLINNEKLDYLTKKFDNTI